MVLGLRSRNKKGSSVRIDCVVHLVEIKPWPPSESWRSIQSLLLRWQNGEQSYGSFSIVGRGESIVLNESFTIPLTMKLEKRTRDKFKKNILEFSLIEPRKDKGSKEQLLGTATVNLAEYGFIENNLSITVPLNCKRSSKSFGQPMLLMQIEPLDKVSSKSSPNVGSSISMEDAEDSFADMDGDNSEIASFTDDDISSHSSLTLSSTFEAARASPSRSDKESLNEFTRSDQQQSNGSITSWSSAKLVSSASNLVNNHNPKAKFPERSMTSIQGKSSATAVSTSSSFRGYNGTYGKSQNYKESLEHVNDNSKDGFIGVEKTVEDIPRFVKDQSTDQAQAELETATASISNGLKSNWTNYNYSQDTNDSQAERIVVGDVLIIDENKEKQNLQDESILSEKDSLLEDKIVNKVSEDTISRQRKMTNVSPTSTALESQISHAQLRHTKSQMYDSSNRNRVSEQYKTGNGTKARIDNHDASSIKNIQKGKETGSAFPDAKLRSALKMEEGPETKFSGHEAEWKSKTEILEEELRETATLEVGLYSIVAEHGSSMNKVHAPARRMSRFYLHACRENSRVKLARAARAVISGLVLVSKACGNDVPRLTFWLSNAIMLRAIVSQAASETPDLDMKHMIKSNRRTPVPDSNSTRKQGRNPSINDSSSEECDGWEDRESFIYALERTESWIFSRIVESIWWQTLTQHMQPTVAKYSGTAVSTKKSNSSKYGLGDQEQGNFSIELWKKAFRDACERLCPIRAEGHECGCLSVMTRMVMEQLVIRLDVAMFNAILRESAEEMPSDPLSDPITEPRVLPIIAGKLCFGAGAQLKNAIGNWTRWLSDLFENEEIDSPIYDETCSDETACESFKAFRLLNALSDIMMLPFEMLTDKSTRKEVCPALGPALIKKVLSNFVPDQFCPYPIPQSVLDALDSEDDLDVSTEAVSCHPCTAPPTAYSAPVVTSLKYKGFTLEVGNHNVTSDNELDEMDTNVTLIFNDSFRSPAAKKLGIIPKGDYRRRVARFHLLREIWDDC